MRFQSCLAALACLLVVSVTLAADPPPLETAQGTVDKVSKNSLVLRPRGPDGRFGKALALRLTGTSRVTILAPQTRGGKLVLTQKDTDASELQPKQTIAVIYTTPKEGPVLLTAVVQPAPEKSP